MTDYEQSEAVVTGLEGPRKSPGFDCSCGRYSRPKIGEPHTCQCGRVWRFKCKGMSPAWVMTRWINETEQAEAVVEGLAADDDREDLLSKFAIELGVAAKKNMDDMILKVLLDGR